MGAIGLIQVIDYYSKKGLVANLHAEKPPKEVTVEVQKALSWWAYVLELKHEMYQNPFVRVP